MFRHTRRALLVCAATFAVLIAPGVAQADVLNDWNVLAQNHAITLRPTAHGQTRGIAMVQGAVYDAVNAIDRGHQPYLLNVQALGVQPWASADAAIATAAHHVLVKLVAPTQVAGLDAAYQATLDGVPDGLVETEGVRAGEAAAAAMLAARGNDGYFDPFDFNLVIGPDPGDWRPVTPTALDPDASVGDARPFLIESPSQFRSKGPNVVTSKKYAKDFDEVKSLGALNSTTRTADQTAGAIFWQFAPAVLYNRLTREVSAARQLDVVDEARLLAMVNLAAADGAISCWNDKWYWHFWRPRAAIQEAATDGNPDTVADPSWEPLFHASTQTTPPLTTPPFPDHPSGHGCVSGSVLNTLREFFGTDKIGFDMHSGRFPVGDPRETRHFDSFSDALQEVIDARVWGGIHFRTADVQGAVIGRKVARYARKHYFNRVR